MTDVLICSFFTDDDYYRTKKDSLVQCLESLKLNYYIEEMPIPDGMQWSDICRKKINFISRVCDENPNKKILWIDVDCTLDYFPDFILNFSADIIGFARGFSSPVDIGYHKRSRFWEPCFLGINTTLEARKFIKDANRMENEFQGSATDDYFFEEAWRSNCDKLSYQVIPSHFRVGVIDDSGFFNFGSSGNVDEFKGKVVQHKKSNFHFGWFNDVLKSLLLKLDRTGFIKRIYLGLRRRYFEFFHDVVRVKAVGKGVPISKNRYRQLLLSAAISNDRNRKDELEEFLVDCTDNYKNDLQKQASAILEYRNYVAKGKPLDLFWWFDPAPGNIGDWLSPYIVSRISQRDIQLISPSQMKKHSSQNIVCVGSVAKFVNDHSVVIGAGISRVNTQLNSNANYLSLRGPKTGQVLNASGAKDPCVYGDPAIVMPRLYSVLSENIEKYPGRGLLVKHFSHNNLEVLLPENIDELSILASSAKEIETFINELHKYDFVITSAMHCYILCHAYGIPSALVVFEGGERAVAGDGLKYLDYAEGVGVEPLMPKKIPVDLRDYDLNKVVRNIRIEESKINELYAFLKKYLEDDSVVA